MSFSIKRNRWFTPWRISTILDRSKCPWSCVWPLIFVNLRLLALNAERSITNKMIFIFKSSFLWWLCLLPWIVFFLVVFILLLIFKFNPLLFVSPWNLLLLGLFSFLQISVSDWSTKLLLLRICPILVINTSLWPCRFYLLIVVKSIVWRSHTRLKLIIQIRWKNLIWWMKLVNCHLISPAPTSFSLLKLIRFLFLILFLPRIPRVLIVIVLLTRLFPDLVKRWPIRFWKSWAISPKIDLWLVFKSCLLMVSFIRLNRRMCKRNSHPRFFSVKSVFLIVIIYLVLVYWTTSPHRLILLVTFLSLFAKLILVLASYIPLSRRLRWVVKVWHFLFL